VPVVKALATPLRKSALPPRDWSEDAHSRDHGRFSSSPGAGAAPKPSGPGKPASQAPPPTRSQSSVLQAFAAAAEGAGNVEAGVSAWIERQAARLPKQVVAPVRGFLRAGFASYRAAQAAVDAVAKERGFSDEQRLRLGKIVSVVDLVGGGKLFPMALQAAGAGPMGSLAGGFVPVGSLGYLAYSTVRDPAATWRAASGAVRARLGVAKNLGDGQPDFDALLSALASRDTSDAWFACFAEALDQTSGDVGQSLAVADEVAPSLPSETTVAKKSMSQAGYGSKCPTCGEPCVGRCRCLRADSWCKNGHGWHRCTVHDVIVIGKSDHGKSGCSCGGETTKHLRTAALRSPLRKSAPDDEPRDDSGRWTAGGAHTDRHDRELSTRYDEGESDHGDLGERAASHYAEHAADHLFQASAPLGHQLGDFASVAADYAPDEATEEARGWVETAKAQAAGVLGLPDRLAQTAEHVYQETPGQETAQELTTALQGAYAQFSTALEGDGTFTVEEMAAGLAEGEDREEYESHADAFGDHLAKARDAFEGAVKTAVAAYWSRAASEADDSAARSIATPLRAKSLTAFIPGLTRGTIPPSRVSKSLPSPLRRPTL
jgi:hypothetical protein